VDGARIVAPTTGCQHQLAGATGPQAAPVVRVRAGGRRLAGRGGKERSDGEAPRP